MEQEKKLISIKIPDNVIQTGKRLDRPVVAESPAAKRRRLKPRYRRRFIARLSAIVLIPLAVIGMAVWALSYKNAVEVYAADELVGTLRTDKLLTVESLALDAETKLMEENQTEVIVTPNITLKPVHASKDSILEKEELMDKLCVKLPYQVKAVAFVLDGKPLAVLKDEAEALTVQDNIFAKYASRSGEVENSSFVENVSIEDIFAEKSAIITMGKAFDALTAESAHPSVYTVQQDDVLGAIAERNKMTLSELIAANPGVTVNSTLSVGQELNVETKAPVLSVKTVETIVADEIAPAPVQRQINPRAKTERVLQEGQDGQQRVTKRVTRVNGIAQHEDIINTVTLEEPTPRIVEIPPQ
ncbi:MAG: G5 domain-containing protein [Clostridiales bacterium]|jgi:LysM repeat protein|nr:G5 domain-containing protein [Clostridiales bacterium]